MADRDVRKQAPAPAPPKKEEPPPQMCVAPPSPQIGPAGPMVGPMGPQLAPTGPALGPVADPGFVGPVLPATSQEAGNQPATEKKWWEQHQELNDAEARKPEIDTKAMKDAATALHSAMSGWGTDEDAIFNALRGKSPDEIAAIRNEFKKHYDADLDEWLKDELGGDDLKEATALMEGDKVKGVLAGLENSTGFWNDDEAKIESLMRSLSPEELAQLKAHPKWGALSGHLNDALGGEDQEVFQALESGDRAKASAIRLDEAMGSSKSWYNPSSWGTDEQQVYDNLANLPPEERAAAEAAFNERMKDQGKDTTLRDELSSELSTADEARAVASLDNDVLTEKAAKIEQMMEGMGTDEKGLFAELESMPESQRAQVLEAYEAKFGVSLAERLDGEVSGVDAERATMAAEGQQDDTFKLFYGMQGMGTDEQLLKDTLAGKSATEIQAMRDKWNTEFAGRYGADFDSAFNSELSGRDHFDVVEIAMRGEPQTPEEMRQVMELQYEYERGDRSTWLGRNMMDFAQDIGFTDSTRVLDMQYERLQETIGPDGQIKAPDSAIADLYGYAQEDVKAYREAKDQVTDAIATGAELTVATIATIATAGSASPFLAAALSSALGGVVGMGAKALMQGEAYGIEQIGVDALTTAMGAALGGLNESADLIKHLDEMSGVFGPKFAAMVAAETGNPLLRQMYIGTTKGMVVGAGHGMAGGIMNEDALRSGFGDYLGGIATGAGTGMLRGGVAGMTASTMSYGTESMWNAEGLGQTLTKEVTKNTAIELALTATDMGTWEGRPEDILARFGGSAVSGMIQGLGEGIRDHRANQMALRNAGTTTEEAKPTATELTEPTAEELVAPSPGTTEEPKLLPAPEQPKLLPAPEQPAGLLPAPDQPKLLPAPDPVTEAGALDALARFEAQGGSKELVDWALENWDPARVMGLIETHGPTAPTYSPGYSAARDRVRGGDETHAAFATPAPEGVGTKQHLMDPAAWAPERAALHGQMLDTAIAQGIAFDEAIGGDPAIYAMRGNTAAGKTRAIEGHIEELAGAVAATEDLPHRAVNPDNFKSDIYRADADLPLTSSQVHTESSVLGHRYQSELAGLTREDGSARSFLVDKRLGDVEDVTKLAELAGQTGRNLNLYDVDAPLEMSLAGVLGRTPGGESPIPPVEAIAQGGFVPARANRLDIIEQYRQNPELGTYDLFGTGADGGKSRVAQVRGGELEVFDPGQFESITRDPTADLPGILGTTITPEYIDQMVAQYPEGFAKWTRGNLEPYIGSTWEQAVTAHSQKKAGE